MSRYSILVDCPTERDRAMEMLRKAPLGPQGFYVEFKRDKRSKDQNALMWVYLTAFSKQCDLMGQKYSADDWKLIFMDALGHELRLAPSLSGSGTVNLSTRTSKLTIKEMTDLIELIISEAEARGVDLGENPRLRVMKLRDLTAGEVNHLEGWVSQYCESYAAQRVKDRSDFVITNAASTDWLAHNHPDIFEPIAQVWKTKKEAA